MTRTGIHAIDQRARREFRRTLRRVAVDDGRIFPWRASRDPYVVLLAEVLLQRTRGPNVAERFPAILLELPTPAALAAMSTKDLTHLIAPLGLHKRAPILARLGHEIVERHDGRVPEDHDELLKLSGVGPYAAAAVRCFAFDRRMPIVDVGIARILRRVFVLNDERRVNDDPVLWSIAADLLPVNDFRHHNLALLAVADAFCRVRPHCRECPLRDICQFAAVRDPRPEPSQASDSASIAKTQRPISAASFGGTAFPT